MSVVSIINTGDAVHLLTDGGLFNRGVVERITNKARAFPHLNAAFAFRSSIGWWTFLIERVGYSFSSFDGVVDGIADFSKEISAPSRQATNCTAKNFGFAAGPTSASALKPTAFLPTA